VETAEVVAPAPNRDARANEAPAQSFPTPSRAEPAGLAELHAETKLHTQSKGQFVWKDQELAGGEGRWRGGEETGWRGAGKEKCPNRKWLGRKRMGGEVMKGEDEGRLLESLRSTRDGQ
jgi:hypothetical protein